MSYGKTTHYPGHASFPSKGEVDDLASSVELTCKKENLHVEAVFVQCQYAEIPWSHSEVPMRAGTAHLPESRSLGNVTPYYTKCQSQ